MTVAVPCPCCRQRLSEPPFEVFAEFYKITPLEGRVLGAIWKGKGLPVMTERIFDAMYLGIRSERPSAKDMYLAFKVALSHIRGKIRGSGVDIENVGYRQGYRMLVASSATKRSC